MDIITVNKVNVNYGSKPVLKDLSMSFKKNKITAIVGPSGCGKSTFLTTINLMLEELGGRYTGDILFNEKDIRTYNKDTIRKKIGMVFQKPTPFPLSVYKNMTYAPIYYGVTDKGELNSVVINNSTFPLLNLIHQ